MLALILLFVLLIALGGLVFARGRKGHRRGAGDYVYKPDEPLLTPEMLTCPTCGYSLRGLRPDDEELTCPECGSVYDFESMLRPCWVGQRRQIPHADAFVEPTAMLVLMALSVAILFATFRSGRADAMFIIVVSAILTLPLVGIGIVLVKSSKWFRNPKLAVILHAMILASYLGFISSGVLAVAGFFLLVFGPVPDDPFNVPWWAGLSLAAVAWWLHYEIIVRSIAAFRAVHQICLANYVSRIADQVDPFPGFGRAWVIGGDHTIPPIGGDEERSST